MSAETGGVNAAWVDLGKEVFTTTVMPEGVARR
jgi:hypothetical protein